MRRHRRSNANLQRSRESPPNSVAPTDSFHSLLQRLWEIIGEGMEAIRLKRYVHWRYNTIRQAAPGFDLPALPRLHGLNANL